MFDCVPVILKAVETRRSGRVSVLLDSYYDRPHVAQIGKFWFSMRLEGSSCTVTPTGPILTSPMLNYLRSKHRTVACRAPSKTLTP